MSMSWENGLHICENCRGEVDHSEIEPIVTGEAETAYLEIQPGHYIDYLTGNRVEMTPEQFEQSKHLISRLFCKDCRRGRDNTIAAKLLNQ